MAYLSRDGLPNWDWRHEGFRPDLDKSLCEESQLANGHSDCLHFPPAYFKTRITQRAVIDILNGDQG